MSLRVPHHSDCHKKAFPFEAHGEYLQYTHERVVETIWIDEQYHKKATTNPMSISDDILDNASVRRKMATLGRSRIELRITEELANCRLKFDGAVLRAGVTILSSNATLAHIYSMMIGSQDELKTSPRRLGAKFAVIAGAYYDTNGKAAFNNWCKALFGPLARAFLDASEQYEIEQKALSRVRLEQENVALDYHEIQDEGSSV